MRHIIEVKNLKKSYKDVRAVKDISFYAEEGKLFAFLGPNGAGKSTTIDIICTFLRADEGEILVDGLVLGQQDDQIRRSIGAVFQDGLLDQLLTVEENLRVRGSLYGLRGEALSKAVAAALELVGLHALAKRPYGKLSGGQRRRCDIARALVHTPKILFLDEPTTGLDPQTRKAVWDTILTLQKERGMTVFLTTHYMEEAADADYVIVIDDGRIAAKGTPAELRENYASDCLLLSVRDREAVSARLAERQVLFTEVGGRLKIKLPDTKSALPLLRLCEDEIDSFEVLSGTMDDAFLGITGKEMRT
ncbi:MAG: ABC transporter ATP-binding protein [Eubacteriales bacterium]